MVEVGKMYINTYVQRSLETHLFYGGLLTLLEDATEIAEGMIPKEILQSGELLPIYTCKKSSERRPCGDIADRTAQVFKLNQQVLESLYLTTIQKLEKGESMENILPRERDILTKLVEINKRVIKRLERIDKVAETVL